MTLKSVQEDLLRRVGGVPGRCCCVCHQEYTPTYPTKEEALASGNAEAAEQWISGICSSACWDALFSPSKGTQQ